MVLTAENLVVAVAQLRTEVRYNYVDPTNRGYIVIDRVDLPEGPITIRRSRKGGELGKPESISSQLIWRIANAFQEGHPINFDRVLGGSYNTRSVFEALLAHTPEFYFCRPGRIESMGAAPKVREGHKHLIWLPNSPHPAGRIVEHHAHMIVSEGAASDVIYESLTPAAAPGSSLPTDVQRRHSQIQVALYEIGKQLGFKTWIAQNDKGIKYKEQRLGEMEGVIGDLRTAGAVISGFPKAVKAALLIDCVWFKNGKLMPAVMEVEHTTGVTSGLTRMKTLQDILPPFPTRWVVVAADEDRKKVFDEANKEQFKPLATKFFSYSAVEELLRLCQRRKIKGVTEEFLDCYMEPCVGVA
jgi:type II restriction enzyme